MPQEASRAGPIRSHRDLVVWQRAMDLAVEAHQLVRCLRPEVRPLIDQIRRAAASVAANIAEGAGRLHTADYVRHLGIARGSLKELETLVALAVRLGYADPLAASKVADIAEETSRMLSGLIRALRERVRGRSRSSP
jgi:four helix bundle protein